VKSLKVLVTCRQMQESLLMLSHELEQFNWDLECPDLQGRQNFNEYEMASLLKDVDAAIVGDDHITELSLTSARKLKAICKWGVGTDGLDLQTIAFHDIKVGRTPYMFGEEVADVALAYIIGLARNLFEIDRSVRAGIWMKSTGHSLRNMRAAIVGYGDIGQALAVRLETLGIHVCVVDPSPTAAAQARNRGLTLCSLVEAAAGSNFLVIACPLTTDTRDMIGAEILSNMGSPAYVVNVARGPILNEVDLLKALLSGAVTGAALDVLSEEPLALDSPLRSQQSVVFGSHNASNTYEAALRASKNALTVLSSLLGDLE